MNLNIFIRICSILTVLSGLIDFAAAATAIGGLFVPIVPDLVVTSLIMINLLFVVLALIGLYSVQYPAAGALGLAGVSIAMVAALITIFVPLYGWGLYLNGLLLFAIASARTGLLPANAIWFWFLGAFIAVAAGILDFTLLFYLGILIAGSSRIWLGYIIWHEQTIGLSSHPAM